MVAPHTVDSRWWYGVAAIPIAHVLLLGYVGLLLWLGSRWDSIVPVLRSSPGLLLLVVVGGFLGGVVLFGSGLVSLLAPLFILLDVRAIRDSGCPWSPTWAYGLLGLGPVGYALAANVPVPTVLNQFDYTSLLFVLTIAGPLAYLFQRRRHVGVPFGRPRAE